MAKTKAKAVKSAKTRKLKVNACADCNATGLKDASTLCPSCEGSGQVK